MTIMTAGKALDAIEKALSELAQNDSVYPIEEAKQGLEYLRDCLSTEYIFNETYEEKIERVFENYRNVTISSKALKQIESAQQALCSLVNSAKFHIERKEELRKQLNESEQLKSELAGKIDRLQSIAGEDIDSLCDSLPKTLSLEKLSSDLINKFKQSCGDGKSAADFRKFVTDAISAIMKVPYSSFAPLVKVFNDYQSAFTNLEIVSSQFQEIKEAVNPIYSGNEKDGLKHAINRIAFKASEFDKIGKIVTENCGLTDVKNVTSHVNGIYDSLKKYNIDSMMHLRLRLSQAASYRELPTLLGCEVLGEIKNTIIRNNAKLERLKMIDSLAEKTENQSALGVLKYVIDAEEEFGDAEQFLEYAIDLCKRNACEGIDELEELINESIGLTAKFKNFEELLQLKEASITDLEAKNSKLKEAWDTERVKSTTAKIENEGLQATIDGLSEKLKTSIEEAEKAKASLESKNAQLLKMLESTNADLKECESRNGSQADVMVQAISKDIAQNTITKLEGRVNKLLGDKSRLLDRVESLQDQRDELRDKLKSHVQGVVLETELPGARLPLPALEMKPNSPVKELAHAMLETPRLASATEEVARLKALAEKRRIELGNVRAINLDLENRVQWLDKERRNQQSKKDKLFVKCRSLEAQCEEYLAMRQKAEKRLGAVMKENERALDLNEKLNASLEVSVDKIKDLDMRVLKIKISSAKAVADANEQALRNAEEAEHYAQNNRKLRTRIDKLESELGQKSNN